MPTNDFEDARQATIDMFEAPEEEVIDTPPEEDIQPPAAEQQEQPAEDTNTQVVDEAANIAQVAAQAAAEKDEQLKQVMMENEQLKQANSELQDTITQQSQVQKEQIVEDAMQMPMLDVNALAFENEATVRQMQEDYAKKMHEYVRAGIDKEIAPVIEYAKAGMRERERSEVINALREVPELEGIEGMLPQLDRIIQSNKALSAEDVPLDERYITAYAIAKGVNAINTPPPPPPSEPTAQELMEYYKNNPEFQQLVEKDRLNSIKQSQQVPAMSASNGAVNAALNIPEKPKTWDEASQRTRNMFREDD